MSVNVQPSGGENSMTNLPNGTVTNPLPDDKAGVILDEKKEEPMPTGSSN
jgi:hypothetical protein